MKIKYKLLTTLLILLYIFGFLFKLERTKPIQDKWIETDTIVTRIYEFDLNGEIKYAKYAFLNQKSFVILTDELNFVDSLTWFQKRKGDKIRSNWPHYDNNIKFLKPPKK